MRSAFTTSQVNVTGSPALIDVALAVKLKTFADGPSGNPSRGSGFGAGSCCANSFGGTMATIEAATNAIAMNRCDGFLITVACPQQVWCPLPSRWFPVAHRSPPPGARQWNFVLAYIGRAGLEHVGEGCLFASRETGVPRMSPAAWLGVSQPADEFRQRGALAIHQDAHAV